MTRMEKFKDLMADAFEAEVLDDKAIQDMAKELADMGFFDAPASTKYHGNYPGGLFDHSWEVTQQLLILTNCLGLMWSRPESPVIVGMFHDLCKIDQYKQADADTQREPYTYNDDRLLKGHGDKSAMLAGHFMPLTMEEILCIRYHMGAFGDKDEQNAYSNAVKQYPNVLWTHTADMAASQVNGI